MPTTTDSPPPLRCLIIAGEVSGDMHAAPIVKALRAQSKRPIEFYGIGGNRLKELDVELFYHTDQTGVMGFIEVAKRIRFFSRMMKFMAGLLVSRRPDFVLTVDYPGFNLRFAQRAHALGILTIHYVCPQVWAWHQSRIPKIAANVDLLLTLFPFEPACFKETNLDARYTGHPLVDRARETRNSPTAELPWATTKDAPRLALLPGSRSVEIKYLLTDMLATAQLLQEANPKTSFIIPAPTQAAREQIEKILQDLPTADRPNNIAIIDGHSRDLLLQADATLISSGTATLEACLMNCPLVVVYRATPITWAIGSRLVKIPHVSLVNIIAKKEVCKELLQHDFTPQRAYEELLPLIDHDSPQRKTMLTELNEINKTLGDGHAATQAATAILEKLSDKS